MSDVITLTQELIRCPSVTPEDAGAFKVVEDFFHNTKFEMKRIERGGISNLFLRWGSTNSRTLGFSGHIDVVPPGKLSAWSCDPFSGEILENKIYGRGAVDMKSAVAAFCSAAKRYASQANPTFSIALLLTGDEEGNAKDGTRAIIDWMKKNNQRLDHCIVGEPTCPENLGDTVKIGRKGSLSCTFKIFGKQGHSAYPALALNPINVAVDLILRISKEKLDSGTSYFEPSTLVVTSIGTDMILTNVIPSEAFVSLNIRFNDSHTGKSLTNWLQSISKKISQKTSAKISSKIRVSAEPFYTKPSPFSELVRKSVCQTTKMKPKYSTTGGTSDARFIYKICPVVEFGLVGKKMHSVDESIPIKQITDLEQIYFNLIGRYGREIK